VQQARHAGTVEASFPADRYLTMRVEMDGGSDTTAAYHDRLRELGRRLAAVPGVAGVAIADRLPLTSHPARTIEVDLDGTTSLEPARHAVAAAAIGPDFFAVFGAAIVAGRAFSDDEPDDSVVVDELFVDQVLGGRSAIGRRIRDVDARGTGAPATWRRIVGVVRSLETGRPGPLQIAEPPRPFVYRPLAATAPSPLQLVAHVPAGPSIVAPRAHRIAADVSPALRLHDVLPLHEAAGADVAFWRLWADLLVIVSAIALFLALAGIYAVMSFTVSRRTREIGIRVALGAPASRVAAEILRGPALHVVAGVALGGVVMIGVVWSMTNAASPGDGARLLVLGAAILAVCALAAVGPARRALGVAPTEALRAQE
jgi:hypothetical protein